MNPNSGSGEKPTPSFEVEQPPEGLERQRERAMEEKPAVTESAPSQQAPKTATGPAPTMPLPLPSTAVGQPEPTAGSAGHSRTKDLPAQDTDLIEKEWVTRAKTIVNQTQDDPYVQKSEISRAGADYIKKRFDKTIPTDGPAKA